MSKLLSDKELLAEVVAYVREAQSFRKLEANMVNLLFDPEEDAAKHIVEIIQSQKQAAVEEALEEYHGNTGL